MQILYFLLAILILLVMIMIHEFGHYLAAKLFRFKVTEFSIGFGPKLLQKTKKNGEKFSIRAIPLGGYCAFEDTDENGVETEHSFFKEKPYKRIVVLASGATLNFISAILFSFIFLVAVGFTSPVVATVTTNPQTGIPYAALQAGDEVLAVGDYEITPVRTLSDAIKLAEKKSGADNPVVFSVLRGGQVINLTVSRQQIVPWYAGFGIQYSAPTFDSNGKALTHPTVQAVMTDDKDAPYSPFLAGDQITAVYQNGEPKLITSDDTLYLLTKDFAVGETVQFSVIRNGTGTMVFAEKRTVITQSYTGYGFTHEGEIRSLGFWDSVKYSVPFAGKMAWSILGAFGDMLVGNVAVTDMAGPIGTVTQMATISQTDWRNILILLPLLAANLAIFNLLPFPVLDGSRIVFTTIEWIRKKPINRQVENIIHFVGMIVLVLFAVTVDILGFVLRGGSTWLRL